MSKILLLCQKKEDDCKNSHLLKAVYLLGNFAGEAIADAADGFDGVADFGGRGEFGAQVADVDVDCARVAVVFVAPDAL